MNTTVNNVKLWTIDGKIFVPKTGRPDMIKWYHDGLQHSGPERTSSTLRLHFEWPGVVEDVKRHIKKCSLCQKYKITGVKKYGKVPIVSEPQLVPPFNTVHVDMIGPWKIKFL